MQNSGHESAVTDSIAIREPLGTAETELWRRVQLDEQADMTPVKT